MIASEAAGLAISVAKGLIKLAGRVDRLMAEKEAVQGSLIVPMPPESAAPDVDVALRMLRTYLKETAEDDPDPLGADRAALASLLAQDPVPDEWFGFFERIFPEQAHPPLLNPEAEYLKALKKWAPSMNWDDPANTEVRKAAFYIASGRDQRGLGYGARLGLLVADVVAEFGAEHTALFVRDRNAQSIVQSVLERFSKPELETFEDWSPFLRHTLGATLNSLLDSREILASHAMWADALFEALARAREEADDSDNYLVGLLSGRGYSLLVGEGLQMAGEALAAQQAGAFRDIAADFLIEAAPLFKTNEHDFASFFKEHWGDLLHGGLNALAAHGPRLLEGRSPLLKKTLLSVMNQLAATPSASFFTSDAAIGLAEAAIGAVARNPDLVKGAAGEKWMATLVNSVAGTIGDSGLRAAFSRDGLERIFKDTLATFAQHPELIVATPGLASDIVASVLKAIADSKGLELQALAIAGVGGALRAVSLHPELAGTRFGPHVAELAGVLAGRVAKQGLTELQAGSLLSAAVEVTLRNQRLFAVIEDNVASTVLGAILDVAGKSGTAAGHVKLLAGAALVDVAREVLVTVARFGEGFLENEDLETLATRLAAALTAGLAQAERALGRRLDQESLPPVLAGLVRKVLCGELTALDPESAEFRQAFGEVVDAIAA